MKYKIKGSDFLNICCVVVTYNRKTLLLECINSLINQTYKLNKIIIVDNNSSDGTEEYLIENGIIGNKIIDYLKLPCNIGGAGGFHEGIKKTIQEEYDWVWVMDDDSIPTATALEELVKSYDYVKTKNISFLCSKVIGPNNEQMNIPAVSNKVGENGYKIWMEHLDKGMVQVDNATFVSVLINSEAIKKVGFPWKEFFIWGDDIEYTLRLNKYFGPGYVVGSSIVIHKRIGAKNLSIIEENNEQRLNMYRYRYRNDVILLEYKCIKDKIKTILAIIALSISALVKSENYKIKKATIILTSTINGLFNMKLRKSFKLRMNIE